MIIVVADAFSEHYTGGAELTTDAFLDSGFHNYKKILSRDLSLSHIKKYSTERWLFGNFSGVTKEVLLSVIKNINNYSIIEYDYKFCKYRLESKHIANENFCDCSDTSQGKLVALFFARASNLFFMSQGQKKEYEKKFPILAKKKNSYVLSSTFSDEILSFIVSLDTTNKNNKYVILQSNSWVKGVQDCINYANENNLQYELVGGLKHRDMLRKLAESRGLIFLPAGYDTCPRLTIEAKLLDCELIINDNVQHRDEKWFTNKNTILGYLKTQKEFFYKSVLDYRLVEELQPEKNTFHIIIPGYNVSDWLPKCIESIIRQEYSSYTATFIDDMSTDNSCDVYKNLTNGEERFSIIVNKEKKYALRNIADTIDSVEAKPNDIIIILDADDWFCSSTVLSYLDQIYDKEDVLATYGSYMYYPYGDKGLEPSEYPKEVIQNNKYRQDQWRASHLRTFRKKVWDKINEEDLKDTNGEHYHMAYDQAIMLPILEMCGEKAKYIDKILHVYNRANPLNVDKKKQQEQYAAMKRIRARKPYAREKF